MIRVADYIEEIPEEIRDAIKGLCSEVRQAIVICLLRNGELSFSELEDKIGISKANLNFHLKILIKAMLVEHYYRHMVGNEKFSFYSITPFGDNLIKSIVQSLTPSIPLMETTESIIGISVDIDAKKTTTKKLTVPVGVSGRMLQTTRIETR